MSVDDIDPFRLDGMTAVVIKFFTYLIFRMEIFTQGFRSYSDLRKLLTGFIELVSFHCYYL